jgi:DNA-binding NtrC family response regulator
LLARTLIEQICRDLEREVPELTPVALAILQEHPWPGNVRELRNALERALLATNGPVIDRSELLFLRQPSARSRPQSFGNGRSMTLTEAEGWFIKQTLEDAQGRVELAAIRLGISRSALYNKIKKHGLGAAR